MTQTQQLPGLSSAEARRRLDDDGPNVMATAARHRWVRDLARQLTHLLALLLWVAVVLAFLAGMPALAIAIAVIVVLNGVFAFWQEYRADRSTERLRQLLPDATRVLRDGRPTTISAAELVAGDVVLLAAGDRISADMQLDNAHALRVDESLVTGESGGIAKRAGDPVLAGTFVVQGEGTATVTATGTRTTLSDISSLARSAQRPPSPLSRQLGRVVRILAVIAASTGVLLGVGALLLGLDLRQAFLFGVGVAVALVPEGLLPTVTLSLARGAQLMAGRNALVRRLDAVETLGATTFICTDKTGTLTENRMEVVEVLTTAGVVQIAGDGYQPVAELVGSNEAVGHAGEVAADALACVTGRVVERTAGQWGADGDPMEAAIHCLAVRCGSNHQDPVAERVPYTADRMLSSSWSAGRVSVLGAPEQVFERCRVVPAEARECLADWTERGRRVLAVAHRQWTPAQGEDQRERELTFVGLLGLQDPPRKDVGSALTACRRAGIRVAMVTGDHPRTAAAIGHEVGLLGSQGLVITGAQLPADDSDLGAMLDRPDGVVVARVTPADKFRIAKVLRTRGHVVAMTGDGVNDAPALKEADVGVAMGASGSDVAREAADLVLLDDHFGTIVHAVELGRATFSNVRRFLTYHLTDNVAELMPFALWAMSGGQFPLAIGVLQVLALDIGTDMLPALALGAEPPNGRIMDGRPRRTVVDRSLLIRAFGVLGATEATLAMIAFAGVLVAHGWRWGDTPAPAVLAIASGTAFAAIAIGQMANAFACRSTVLPLWRQRLTGNRLLLLAVGVEIVLLVALLGLPPISDLLGGSWPPPAGWGAAALAGIALLAVDAGAKAVQAHRRRSATRAAADNTAAAAGQA